MTIDEIVDKFVESEKKMINDLRELLVPNISSLLQGTKGINSINWVQYTPYFNDGDECTFSVYADIGVNGVNIYDLDDEENTIDEYLGYGDSKRANPNYSEEDSKVYNTISSLLGKIPEKVLQTMFGDHCEVTINRDGTFKVDGYEHD